MWLIAVLLLAALVLSPRVISICKRKKMLARLTQTAEKNGFRVLKLHRFVYFARNRAQMYDVLFESRERAFAVKLWSAVNIRATLVVDERGGVRESAVLPPELDTHLAGERVHTAKYKRVPRTRCNFKLKENKPTEYIMLYYPQNKAAVLQKGGQKKYLKSGDRIFDKILCTPKYFAEMLTKANTKNVNKTDDGEKSVEKILVDIDKQM